ncbi:MAG: T9SS type A sorting domain-containing protein [Ferruginibacter sp.]|nr:T9SS type A sorting domain-containing protein [Cytophagales bacterium]
MEKTVLFFLLLLAANFASAQGSRAQADVRSEGQSEDTTPVPNVRRQPARLNPGSTVVPWQMTSKAKPTTPGQSASAYRYGVIGQFFKRSLITPPATKVAPPLVPIANAHAPAVQSVGNPEPAPTGERLFSNQEATFSSIYPNPAATYAFIDYSLSEGVRSAKVVLYNVLGTPVSESVLAKEEKKLRISTFALDSGFYYYTLFVDGKSLVTRRLVVKH